MGKLTGFEIKSTRRSALTRRDSTKLLYRFGPAFSDRPRDSPPAARLPFLPLLSIPRKCCSMVASHELQTLGTRPRTTQKLYLLCCSFCYALASFRPLYHNLDYCVILSTALRLIPDQIPSETGSETWFIRQCVYSHGRRYSHMSPLWFDGP